MTNEANALPRILIVEDNPADAYLTQLALREALPSACTTVDDGGPAIAYLKSEEPYRGVPLPDLVILDLNLKRVDGLEVLRWIRTAPGLAAMPVVVLSSSPQDAHHDVALEATCYIQKPCGLDQYLTIGPVIRDCLERSRA